MAEPSTLRLKRLRHRSIYRGCRESDLIFAAFAERHLGRLAPTQLDRYEALLDESDQDLLAWITGVLPAPPVHDHDVLAMLRAIRLEPLR
jgi:antitoxin CptB